MITLLCAVVGSITPTNLQTIFIWVSICFDLLSGLILLIKSIKISPDKVKRFAKKIKNDPQTQDVIKTTIAGAIDFITELNSKDKSEDEDEEKKDG